MPSIRMRLLAVFLMLISASVSARADIYGYIDEHGDAHFSTEKIDARYQLFLRGSASFDSSQLAPAPAVGPRSALFRYISQHPNLKKYEPLLNDAAKDFSVEPALLKAVMAAESGFNPSAVSNKGALGLMQLLPDTAARYGVVGDKKKNIEQKLFDPKTNIRLGARYLRDLRALFPDRPELVIASYNAGEKAVQKYNNKIPPYPETRTYVQLVSQFYQFYRPAGDGTALAARERSGAGNRIFMTIPGRGNMPAAPLPTTD